jgi:hypothetical protein
MEQFLRQPRNFTGISFLNCFCLTLAIAWIPLGPTGPTLLPGPTKRLGWLGSWTPTRTAFEMSQNIWTASHCPVGLFLTLLLNSPSGLRGLASGVLAWTAKKLPTVRAEDGLLPCYRGDANPQRAWMLASVWFLLNTSQYIVTYTTDG